MNVFLVFLIIREISIFGNDEKAKDVKKFKNRMLQFSQIKGTLGNYDEMSVRRNQFVTLEDKNLAIFDKFKLILQNNLMTSKRKKTEIGFI